MTINLIILKVKILANNKMKKLRDHGQKGINWMKEDKAH